MVYSIQQWKWTTGEDLYRLRFSGNKECQKRVTNEPLVGIFYYIQINGKKYGNTRNENTSQQVDFFFQNKLESHLHVYVFKYCTY